MIPLRDRGLIQGICFGPVSRAVKNGFVGDADCFIALATMKQFHGITVAGPAANGSLGLAQLLADEIDSDHRGNESWRACASVRGSVALS